MKKIYNLLMVFAAAACTFVGCSEDNDPFITADENSDPKILNSDISEPGGNGKPFSLTGVNRDVPFTYEIIVTPSQFTTVTWDFNGKESVHTGNSIDTLLMAGIYDIKIVATTTAGKKTSRTCQLEVKALEGDPVLTADDASRILSLGESCVLVGSNLEGVTSVSVGGNTYPVEEASEGSIRFTPTVKCDREQIALNTDNGPFGGNFVTVTSDVYVAANELSAKPGTAVTIKGANLNKIESIQVGGVEVEITSKSVTELTFICPNLENDTYVVSVTANGASVSFNGGYSCTMAVMSAYVIWTGNHVVGWDDSGFEDVLDKLRGYLTDPGAVLHVYIEYMEADYHLACAVVDWANIETGKGDPERGDVTITEDVVLDYTLDAAAIERIQNGGKFGVVGFGCKVTKITLELPEESVLWEGPVAADWNESLINIPSDKFADIPVGKKILVYWQMNSGDYHNFRVVGPWWGPDIVAQIDLTDETPNPYVIDYTDAVKEIVETQGAFCCVGFGYDCLKITLK